MYEIASYPDYVGPSKFTLVLKRDRHKRQCLDIIYFVQVSTNDGHFFILLLFIFLFFCFFASLRWLNQKDIFFLFPLYIVPNADVKI